MDQPTAEQALRRLEPLVGEWPFEASWPDGEAWPGGGRVTFEWQASGAPAPAWDGRASRGARQRLHHRMRRGQRDVLPALLRRARRLPVYEMSIGNGEWKLWREGEPFSQPFTATFSDDGNTITGRRAAEDGTHYATDFDLVCHRVPTDRPGAG
jgi:hypothetical protein